MSEIPLPPDAKGSVTQPTEVESSLSPEINISGQELVDNFQSNTFRTAIHFMSAQRRKSGQEYEGGFTIFRDLQTRNFSLIYDRHIETYETGSGDNGRANWDQRVSGRFGFISLHYHPYFVDSPLVAFMPSMDDLDNLRGTRDLNRDHLPYDTRPLGVIAFVKDRHNTEMVLYQETTEEMRLRPSLRYYEKDIKLCERLPEIVDVLSGYDFKAAQVTYTPRGLTPQHQEVLRSFEFTMKPYQPPQSSSTKTK